MIERKFPVLHTSLLLVGIIDEREVTAVATSFNTPYKKRVICWEKLSDYVSSPLLMMQEAYGWNTPSFDYDSLIANLHHFGQSIRLFSSLVTPDKHLGQSAIGASSQYVELAGFAGLCSY